MPELQIYPKDAASLRYWCHRLQASEDELRRAVDQVGPNPDKVREHLMGGFNDSGPTS